MSDRHAPLPNAPELRAIGTIRSPFTTAAGTPIQPYVPAFDAHPRSRAGWYDELDVAREVADERFHRDPEA